MGLVLRKRNGQKRTHYHYHFYYYYYGRGRQEILSGVLHLISLSRLYLDEIVVYVPSVLPSLSNTVLYGPSEHSGPWTKRIL